jgi:hypothetical protein
VTILHGRNKVTCSTNCKYRTTATLYTLDTRFVCFKYIIVNTLHKSANKNTNTNNNNHTACRVLGLVTSSCPIKSPTQMSSSAQRVTCSYEGGSEDRVTAV